MSNHVHENPAKPQDRQDPRPQGESPQGMSTSLDVQDLVGKVSMNKFKIGIDRATNAYQNIPNIHPNNFNYVYKIIQMYTLDMFETREI